MEEKESAYLNDALYGALYDLVAGDIEIKNEAVPCDYIQPKAEHMYQVGKLNPYDKKDKRKITPYLRVGPKGWGEIYNIDCPICDDDRKRLFISHASGLEVQTSKTVTQKFGYIYKCHNEGCSLWAFLQNLMRGVDPEAPLDPKKLQKKAFRIFDVIDCDLPPSNFPIISHHVPASAKQYLIDRGYDIADLAEEYDIRFLPAGSIWHFGDPESKIEKDRENKITYEDRILIPIICQGSVVSWQARVCDSEYTGKRKYLFQKGCNKSQYLYNMDKAKFFKNIVIVEGIPDAWKVGNTEEYAPVCIFGKCASEWQKWVLETLWGFDGKCVIMLDPEEFQKMQELKEFLDKSSGFPNGVEIVVLASGYDPGNYTHMQLKGILTEAFTKCKPLTIS